MENEVIVVDEKAVVKIDEECNVWLEKAKVFKITSQESLLEADVLVKDIKRHRTDTVEKELGPPKEAAFAAYKASGDLYKKYVDPLKDAEKAIKDKMIVFSREQDRIAQEKAEKDRREAEEAAAAKIKQLEKEAEEAAAAGKTEEFEQKAAEAEEVTAEDHMPVAQPAPSTPKGTTVKEKWKAEVTDLWELIQAVAKDKNLINALKPNEVYLGQRARSDKKAFTLNGVRVWNEGSVSIKT